MCGCFTWGLLLGVGSDGLSMSSIPTFADSSLVKPAGLGASTVNFRTAIAGTARGCSC